MSVHRHFTMSALGALIAIRRYLQTHSEADAVEAATAIKRMDADFAGSDFRSALEIHEFTPKDLVFQDYHNDLRATLAILILKHRPWWVSAVPYGRDRVASAVGRDEEGGRDELQSLHAAGLFDQPISDEAVVWWDILSQKIRGEVADNLLMQGRVAERLSMNHERDRLRILKIDRTPQWTSLDDNGAGFDIKSFDASASGPISRLIEVKSSAREVPRIFLTRNEWDTAVRFGKAYLFHVWRLPSQELIELMVDEVAPHVPVDQGSGGWSEAIIEIDWL